MKTSKQSKHLNASLILQRLPLHRQLSLSRSLLTKCSPIWEKWAKENLVSESASAISLSHFEAGELTIHCDSAIFATQIKQQHETLVDFFQSQGMAEIKHITVRIANNPKLTNYSNTEAADITKVKQHLKYDAISPSRESQKLDKYTLNSIKSAQKSTTSEVLSESLNRLIETIEQTNKSS